MVGGFVAKSFSSLINNGAHANATADYHVVGGFIDGIKQIVMLWSSSNEVRVKWC